LLEIAFHTLMSEGGAQVSKRAQRWKAISRLDAVDIIHDQPCSVRWDAMVGDEVVRKCPYCRLNVYNFAKMTPEAICETINRHEGKMCAAFYARADGTMTLSPCAEAEQALFRGGIGVIERP
jgi:hypothetical protein